MVERRRMRHPLRNRFVLIGAAIIAAVIAASGLVVQMQRLASLAAFRVATVNLSRGMAAQTAQSFAELDLVLGNLATGLAGAGDGTPAAVDAAMGSDTTAHMLEDRRALVSFTDALAVVDATGRVVGRSGTWPVGDVAGSDVFRYFRGTDDHAAFVGAPVRDAASGEWTALWGRRVEAQGRFAGLVVAVVSLTRLQEFYHLAAPPGRSIYVLRADGMVMARYPARDALIGRMIPHSSPWYAQVAKGGGAYHAPGYFGGNPVIGAVRVLPHLPLVIEAQVAEADALEDWYARRLWVLLGCAAAIVCVILLLRLFAGQYRRLEVSQRSLAAAHGQLEATLANLSQGVCFYDRDNRLVVSNRRFCELYDLPPDAVRPGMALAEVAALRMAAGSFTDLGMEEYLALVDRIRRGDRPRNSAMRLANGRIIAAHVQPLADGGWVATHEDITERRKAQAEIAFLARHDVLTGLANRALFQEGLTAALAQAREGQGFALLLLDLDRFKAVNDTFGHGVGDSLLRAVAARLGEAVRETDMVARLGGDEFAIIQRSGADVVETGAMARRIVQAILAPFLLDGHDVGVGISVGIAMAPGDGVDATQLIRNADLALYRAKQDGRGTWRFFAPGMDDAARTKRSLELDLQTAVRAGQLELYYQPVVSSRRRIVQGFETLLRWRHPTRGFVPPSEFIPIAEEMGLIGEIGAWALRHACAEAAGWPEHVRIAVNLSLKQFRDKALVETVAAALRAAGLRPARLELEVTESVPLRQDQATLSTLHALHALGVRIALDDFGTGYSSLSYLSSFPFDTIKIDQSFVKDLRPDGQDMAIIRGIIGLAANLDMSVIAEGVETEAQLDILADAGCTDCQGYLFSRPVPARDVPSLIRALSGQAAAAGVRVD